MRYPLHFLAILFASLIAGGFLRFSTLAAAEEFVAYHENVLGTNLELRLKCDSEAIAIQAEKDLFDEIDRLSSLVSTYDSRSELMRWMGEGQFKKLSSELIELLNRTEDWHRASQGAFHPGVEAWSRLWRKGEVASRIPSSKEMESVKESLSSIGWRWNQDRTMVSPVGMPLSFNAIAKGFIIDRVCEKLATRNGIHGGLVSIGGDMKAFGELRREVTIPAPDGPINAHSIDAIELFQKSVATSSGAFRGFQIQGVRYSHLIDPRTGFPVRHQASVTVVADSATDADALATACSVLTPEQGLELIENHGDTACLIMDSQGNRFESSRWSQFRKPATQWVAARANAEDWNGGMELRLDFKIHQEGNNGRYRRPYVAAWIEDKDGYPVRTLCLWAQTSGPGPRWIPDLKRWYRSDRLRKLADDTDLVATVAEATRKPGEYSLTWDGRDDHQKLVSPGTYTLYLEAAREHGTYQLIRKKIELQQTPFEAKLEENVEIKNAKIEYRKRSKTTSNH